MFILVILCDRFRHLEIIELQSKIVQVVRLESYLRVVAALHYWGLGLIMHFDL